MGKRKKSSRKPQGPKKREPLATTFKCVFCNHETSVSVKIDKKGGVATLQCKSCGQSYQTGSNYLTQPVDVYADWIDACDAVAEDAAAPVSSSRFAPERARRAIASQRDGLASNEIRTAEDDGFIDDDDVDPEAEFVDEE